MASFAPPRASCWRCVSPTKRILYASKPPQSPFSTAAPPLKQARLHLQRPRPSIVARIPPHNSSAPCITITARHASTSTASPSPNQSPSIPENTLTWDRFFDLRRKRRYLNLGASAITAVTAIGIFGPVIAQQDIDGWASKVSGIDPIIVLGITTFAVAAGGWLCGPSIGSGMFKVWAGRRGWNGLIAEKEKSFYARIKRYRADPSSSSPQNPIPDYYGEKIASVKDYRRWLKDQKAFDLKKDKNML